MKTEIQKLMRMSFEMVETMKRIMSSRGSKHMQLNIVAVCWWRLDDVCEGMVGLLDLRPEVWVGNA